MVCYITYVMLYNMCYVVLYNICYVILCYVIQHIVNAVLYNTLLKTESLDNAILAF